MIKIILSLTPSLLFLACLVILDSYKLLRLKTVVLLLLYGMLAALAAYLINSFLISEFNIRTNQYSRFIAPIVEELLKASIFPYLILRNRIGFLAEAAILGFAAGAGFGILENIYYLNNLSEPSLFIWFIRGFGTSIMHACTTAIFAILAKHISEREQKISYLNFAVLLFFPILIHSSFNNFFVSPFIFTAMQLTITPMLFYLVFNRSEKQLKDWMELSLESNYEIISSIKEGKLLETRAGFYFQKIKNKFSPLILADILCYLRLCMELSMLAKGILIMKETGISSIKINEVKMKLNELDFLEKSIGFTGKLTIHPIIYNEKGTVWIREFLKNQE